MSFRDSFERAERDRATADWHGTGMAGDRPDSPSVSRAKPLHWTRIRLIAVAIGAVICAIGTLVIAGAGGGETPFRVMFWMLVGGLAGLTIVSILEAAGVFRRTDA